MYWRHKNMTRTFLQRLQAGEILVSDGATGTNLQGRGLERGKPGEVWVMERPEEIVRLHRDFISAGSDIILTCTFGGTRLRLEREGLAERAFELNQRAVELAYQAAEGTDVLVAGSMGPTGLLLKPLGPMEEEACYEAYAEQARGLVAGGADLLLVETQFDIKEAVLAVKAAKAAGDLPVVCTFSYDRGTRTMMGVKPAQMAAEIAPLGVVALGINCGRSLADNVKALQELKAAATLPLWFKPNAGLPKVDANGVASFDVTPELMGAAALEWAAAGAQVVGGCCGTSPEHLQQIALHVKPGK
jgi:5-methyltetrahydrofolate--homocysteine methyltransferase